MATWTTSVLVILVGASVLAALPGGGEAANAPHRHRARHDGHDVPKDMTQDVPGDGTPDTNVTAEPQCTADVSGESVMVARCRATCLQRFTTDSSDASVECTSNSDCIMCWEYCGKPRRGAEYLASVCKDEYLCWAGCRAACYFHFPYGLQGAGPGSEGRWNLRPTSEKSSSAPPRILPSPRFDPNNSLKLQWRQPNQEAGTTPSASIAIATTSSSTASSHVPDVTGVDTVDSATPDLEPRITSKPMVFIVSGKMALGPGWKELKQTQNNWLELSGNSRAALRAVSVLAVSADGPVAQASACVPALPGLDLDEHDQAFLDEESDIDEEDGDEDDDVDDSDSSTASDGTLQRLSQRSFAQLRGTVQHGALLRALLKDREATKQLVEDAAQEADDDQDEKEILIDQERLDLVHSLLGAHQGHGRAHGRGLGRAHGRGGKEAEAASGWGLRLVGVWAAGDGARLPRARVAWTAPRSVSEALVNWAVPALRISGSRVVSGVSQAEVPLVEQHATRVTVGDAHSKDMSPALVLQLSVQTDFSAAASALGLTDDSLLAPSHPVQKQDSAEAVTSAASVADATLRPVPAVVAESTYRPSYEQAVLWEATLVAVGLVVSAAALGLALLLAVYGVHGRIARYCRGRHTGIHAKSASVEPLNAPDQNNV